MTVTMSSLSSGKSPARTSDDFPQPVGPEMTPTLCISGTISDESIHRFQWLSDGGSPLRSLIPGNSVMKKPASSIVNACRPRGTTTDCDSVCVNSSVDCFAAVRTGAESGESTVAFVSSQCRRSSASSLVAAYRSIASFDRSFRQIRFSSRGIFRLISRGGSGSRETTRCRISCVECPVNARTPVRISYITQPRLN